MDSSQPGTLAWRKDLLRTPEQVRSLITLNEDELEAKVRDMFDLKDAPINLRRGVVSDYYVMALWFGKTQKMGEQSLSAFFTLMHTLFDNCTLKGMPLEDNINYFRGVMLSNGPVSEGDDSKRPDFDLALVKSITAFVVTG